MSSSRAGTYLIRARHEITHENLEVLYDPTLGLIHLDDINYSDLFEGTALKRERLDNGQYQNILFDYQANSFDTLLTQIDRVSYEEHNGNIYYTDSTGLIYKYNLTTKDKVVWKDSGLEYGNRIESALRGDHLVVSSYEETNATVKYKNQYKVYDLNDGALINETSQLSNLKLTNVGYVDDIIVVNATFNNSIFIYNYILSQQTIVFSDNYLWSGLIEGSYLFNYYDEHFFLEPYFELINTNTMDRSRVEVASDVENFSYDDFVRFDNIVLLNERTTHSTISQSFLELNLDSNTARTNIVLDTSSEGFPSNINLDTLADGIILVSDSIYYYSENSGLQVLADVSNGAYAMANDLLYFQPQGSFDLLSFDGQNTINVLDSIEHINLITASESYIYFNTRRTLFRYDITTRELLEFENLGVHDFVFSPHKDELYFTHANSISKINVEGELIELSSVQLTTFLNTQQNLIFTQDKVILVLENGMYCHNDSSPNILDPIVEMPFPTWATKMAIDESVQNILLGTQNSLVHYNGNTVTNLPIDSVSQLQYIGNQKFQINHLVNGETTLVCYDALTQELQPFILAEIVFQHFKKDDRYFLVTGRNHHLSVYEVDSTYTQATFIREFNPFNIYPTSTLDLEDELFLRLGDDFVTFKDGEFTQLSDIRGSRINATIPIVYRNKIYFVANAVEAGRQLFSYESETTSTSEIKTQGVDLTLYPNPSQDEIRIYFEGLREFDNFEYSILSMDGKLVSIGRSTSAIDVSHLKVGTYILQLKLGQTIWSKKFVKQSND